MRNGAAQRRLREACFIAIVTPALKHLRKELAAAEDAALYGEGWYRAITADTFG